MLGALSKYARRSVEYNLLHALKSAADPLLALVADGEYPFRNNIAILVLQCICEVLSFGKQGVGVFAEQFQPLAARLGELATKGFTILDDTSVAKPVAKVIFDIAVCSARSLMFLILGAKKDQFVYIFSTGIDALVFTILNRVDYTEVPAGEDLSLIGFRALERVVAECPEDSRAKLGSRKGWKIVKAFAGDAGSEGDVRSSAQRVLKMARAWNLTD